MLKKLSILLEFTNHCNFDCVMCDTQKLNGPKGFLNLDLLKKLTSEIKQNGGIYGIEPNWYGEPMLHPEFSNFIKFLFEQNTNNQVFQMFSMNTNATLLQGDKLNVILDCASMNNQKKGTFEHLNISIDAACKETYKKFKNRDFFEITTQNIKNFLILRKEINLEYPKIWLKFIVTDENKAESQEFLKQWSNFFNDNNITFNIDSIHPKEPSKDNILFTKLLAVKELDQKSKEIFSQATEKIHIENVQTLPKTNLCRRLFFNPSIRWNGDVSFCCNDSALDYKIGNINDNSLKEIWFSPLMSSLRELSRKGMDIPLCKNCDFIHTFERKELLFLSEDEIPKEEISFTTCLVFLPFWSTTQPPMGISYLKSYLQENGYYAKCFDLNIEFYKEYKNIIPEAFDINFLPKLREDSISGEIIQHLSDFSEKWVNKILKYNPSVIGFTAYEWNIAAIKLFSEKIKQVNPKIKIILGGPYCWINPEIIKYCDIIIKREGEETFFSVLSALNNDTDLKNIKGIIYKENNKIIDTGEADFIKNLDSLPFPDYSDFNLKKYLAKDVPISNLAFPITMSRGCIANCTFCSEKHFWKIYRSRSAKNTFDEMCHLNKKYGTNHFVFADSLINGNLKILEELCDLIIQNKKEFIWGGMARIDKNMDLEFLKKLRLAGCVHLEFGLESGSQKVLDDMRKNITVQDAEKNLKDTKSVGIVTTLFIMIGYPTETEKEFDETLEFIEKNHENIFGILPGWGFGVHPNSYIHSNLLKYGIIMDEKGWHNEILNKNIIESRIKKTNDSIQKYHLEFKEYMPLSKRMIDSSEIENNLIKVFPEKWNDQFFNLWPISYWQGDEITKNGYSLIIGRDYGFISYLFKIPEKEIKSLKISARISSHSKRFEKIPENASEITLLINNVEIGTKLIYYQWPDCDVYEWVIDSQNIKLNKVYNTLTFKIKDNAKYKNGISICYKGLTPEYKKTEMPIIIELK